MKKLTSLGVGAFAALIAVLALVAMQSPAQAYPELSFRLEVNRSVLYGGETFTATAVGNVTCDWSLVWNRETRTAHRAPNAPFETTYTAPQVSKVTKIPLHGTCVYDAEETPTPGARTAATWERTIIITVLPQSSAVSPPLAGGGNGGSDLPNTGGPNLIFLAGGLALVLSGAIAVTVARRRAEEAELRAAQA